MVGGAISGYCAIGSVESAMTPTSVMTMLITPAKIGRSMKKCGKFMPTAVAAPPSFFVLRLRGAFLCVRAACGRLLGNGLHFHSRLQQLQTRRDDFVSIFQSAFHNPLAFEKAAGLKVTPLDSTVGLHHERALSALLRPDPPVRNPPGPIRRRG